MAFLVLLSDILYGMTSNPIYFNDDSSSSDPWGDMWNEREEIIKAETDDNDD